MVERPTRASGPDLKLRRPARRLCTFALLLIAPALARPAHAFGPEAVTAVASRLSHEVSGPTHAALSLEIQNRLDAEAADPEAFAALHRFDASDLGGGAVAEFDAAASALRKAFASPDPVATVAPLARLASAACDLADPFLASPADLDEVPGARATFSDLFDAVGFDALAPIDPIDFDLLNAAATLATQSAARRADIEQAAVAGDVATIDAIRTEQLRAALGLARRAALAAQTLAVGDLPTDLPPAAVALWPNPAPGPVRVSFALAQASPIRVELIDVAGRRVAARELGVRSSGNQSVTLDAATMRALPAGTYFVRLRSNTSEWNGRLVRIAP